MKFVLEITCDNDAFVGPDTTDRKYETYRILRVVADLVLAGHEGTIRDFNGNSVGEFKFVEEESKA